MTWIHVYTLSLLKLKKRTYLVFILKRCIHDSEVRRKYLVRKIFSFWSVYKVKYICVCDCDIYILQWISWKKSIEWKHIDSTVKKKVLDEAICKKRHANSVLGYKRIHHYWFPWKRCNCKRCSWLPTSYLWNGMVWFGFIAYQPLYVI